MSKHTPGPWTVCEHSWSRTGIYSASHPIAALDIYEEATEETQEDWERVMSANAHLIAAAPDLLEALQSVMKMMNSPGEWHQEVRAAIAKATGGQP